VSLGDNPNYSVSTTDGMLKITKAISTTTVSDAGGIYNASAFPATSSVTGAGVVTGSASLDYYDITTGTDLGSTASVNAGNYTVTATYTGDANHTGSTASASFTIAKADATISVTPYDVTYDGKAHTATGTATGVNDEDLSSLFDLSGTAHTNADTYNDDVWR